MSIEPSANEDRLVQALRALPQERPLPDAWPRLAAALAARSAPPAPRRRRRFALWPLAAAAVLLVAIALPRLPVTPIEPESPGAGEAAGDAAMAEWIAHSQWLEGLLQTPALTPTALDADQMLIEQGLRQRIGQIDAALATADDPAAAELWQVRVGALSQLARVRWLGHEMASATGSGGSPVAAPAVLWSN